MTEESGVPTQTRHDEVRRWLAGVGTIAAAVNNPVALSELLNLIARTACELMGYEACGVLLADEHEHALVISGAHGLSAEYVGRVNAEHTIQLGSGPLSEGPSSEAFRSAQPVAIENVSAEPSFDPWAGLAREYGYRAIVAVPLLVGGVPAGTVNCYRTVVHRFGPDEIGLLKTLANQAGIALETARLRAREHETIADLEQLNRSLTEQHRLLQQAEQIHRELTAVALRAGGVQAVADALARLLARPVLVADPAGQPLANAQHRGVLLDPTPVAVPLDGSDAGTDGLTEVAPAGDAATVPLITAPVTLGDELVARVWLPGRLQDLQPLDRRAVEHGAVVSALELLRRRTAMDVEWRLRGDLLSDLLSGNPPAALAARAETLGHDLSRPHSVLVLRGDRRAGTDAAWPVDVRRLLGIAQSAADRTRPRPLVTSSGEYVVLLWPHDPAGREVDPQTAADTIRRSAHRVLDDTTVSVAVSPRCTELRDYAAGFRVARGAVELARLHGGPGRTITLPELGVYGLLLQLEDPRELATFADRVLAPLREYEARKGISLVDTLRTYLDQGLNTTRTATALYLHTNTVALRLKRIEELIGRPLTQPDALLQLTAALMAQDVVELR